MEQLPGIFLNVLAPVFLLVLLGYIAGPRLQLEARTLSRFAYFILTPAFIFNVLSKTRIEVGLATRMTLFIVTVYSCSALIGLVVALIQGHRGPLLAAYVMIAVFGNVGNFGLPIIQFAQGPEALGVATIYFLGNLVLAFIVCVIAANISRGIKLSMVTSVFKTPALLALPPALLANWVQIEVPQVVSRPIELLAAALIPTMLVVLGVQLAGAGRLRINRDVLLSSGVRLISGPVLAFLLVTPFGLTGMERNVAILQASMPTAVLVSIIALENDVMPNFVTTTVLFSNLASIISLTIVLSIL